MESRPWCRRTEQCFSVRNEIERASSLQGNRPLVSSGHGRIFCFMRSKSKQQTRRSASGCALPLICGTGSGSFDALTGAERFNHKQSHIWKQFGEFCRHEKQSAHQSWYWVKTQYILLRVKALAHWPLCLIVASFVSFVIHIICKDNQSGPQVA